MTKQTSQGSIEVPPSAIPDMDQLSRMYAGSTESFLQSGNAIMKAVGELNSEILGFTKQRLDAGLAVGQSLAKCKTMQAALDIQMDFARTEAQIYLDEARKLMELAAQAATDGFKPLRDQAQSATNGHGEGSTRKRQAAA